ncbi:MAG: exo-alpha-sialidase [Phycisphaerales bacterium]|jgi:hypothetical protein|nr:exo-alpha-sialidase [Phycisphaerales bacterium]
MTITLDCPLSTLRRSDRYLSFPALVTLNNGDLLLAFRSGRNCYRDFPEALNLGYQHPHTDPRSQPWLARSVDGGKSWNIEPPPRSFELLEQDHAQGIAYQDVGFTKLPDGRVMLSVFRWKYTNETPPADISFAPREENLAEHAAPRGEITYDYRRYQPFRYAYCITPVYSICDPDGRNWTPFKPIEVVDESTGKTWCLATRNGGVMLDGRNVGWPFYGGFDPATPRFNGCQLFKYDIQTDHWSYETQLAAGTADAFMEEPLLHRHPDGRLIGFYRTSSPGYMFSNTSNDNGQTWTPARQTHVWGHPFAALNIGKDILLAYGYRRDPMGIRASLLKNGDPHAFDPNREIILRSDGRDDDIGYPTLCTRSDGTIILAYYYRSTSDTAPERYIAIQEVRLA